MNEEHSKHLIESYPNLFPEGMWFECGDGWFELINELCKKLENIIIRLKEETPGVEYLTAAQVKEKFGELRFYMHTETDEMSDLINEATELSLCTCEICGQPGELIPGSWVQTLCEEHYTKTKRNS